MKNLANLLVVFAIVFVVMGCCGKGVVNSHRKDCLSADGSQIALTDIYGGITLIDPQTGRIITKKETEKDGRDISSGVALCTQHNDIFSVYPNVLVNLKDNRRIGHRVKGTVFDLVDKETLLTFTGGSASLDSDGDYGSSRPLELYLEKLGQETKDLKPIIVSLDKFEGVKKDARQYWIKPLRLLDHENLLLIAGAFPRGYSRTPNETGLFPEPWGFYVFNLKTEQAKILGTIKEADAEINFNGSPKVSLTKDGRLISLYTFLDAGNAMAVYDTKQDKEIFRKSIEDGEISGTIFSNDETRVAVRVKYLRGEKKRVQYFVNIYDLKTGDLIKAVQLESDVGAFLDFRENELILSSHKKILKMNIDTESIIWETVYFDK